jgi:predicted MPP superfamily phosphohydrolase
MISGHNHDGQVWPQHYIVGLDPPYFYGLYQNVRNTRTNVYVSAGTAYWGVPARLGATNEIAVLTLRSGV